ncbi:hypothetical protein HKX48_008926, partial [Thoreauomyces humboldtii]
LEAKVEELEAALATAADETDLWKKKHRACQTQITKLEEDSDAHSLSQEALTARVSLITRQLSQSERDTTTLRTESDRLSSLLASERADAERAANRAAGTVAELRRNLDDKSAELALAVAAQSCAERGRETDARAVAVVIRTLEEELDVARQETHDQRQLIETLQQQQQQQHQQHPEPTMHRLARSISNLQLKPSTESLASARLTASETEHLIAQLTEHNKTLQDQIEAMRADGHQPHHPHPDSERTHEPVVVSSKDELAIDDEQAGQQRRRERSEAASGSPRIPRRSSSVVELLNKRMESPATSPQGSPRSGRTSLAVRRVALPSLSQDDENGSVGGAASASSPSSLQDELSISARLTAEVEKLKAENAALVSYLVATLDSLNKTAMANA